MSANNSKWRGVSPNAEKPYIWASAAACERAVEVGESNGLAVYIALCRLEARTPNDKKKCFHASLAEIGTLSGLSSRRVGRYLELLHRARLIMQLKPKGAAKIAHQSSQYIILSRKDRTSASEQTERPLPSGQKPMHISSDNKESHALKGHEESPPPGLAPLPSAGAAQGGGEKRKVNSWN